MPPVTRQYSLREPFALQDTLRILQMGQGDPTMQLSGDRAIMAMAGPDGPCTLEVQAEKQTDSTHLTVKIWGESGAWLVDHVPSILGFADDPGTFQPSGRLRRLHFRHLGMRITQLPLVSPRIVQITLMQLVTWQDAFGSWRRLVERFGVSAPGPHDLRAAPTPAEISKLPLSELIACGIIPKLARTIRHVGRQQNQLEVAAQKGPQQLASRMLRIHGIGDWTTQYVLGTAAGQADALLTGDYHVPHTVGWFFAGTARSDDEQMVRLLEPFRGHRFRVVRLLWIGGIHAPRFGPRAATVRRSIFAAAGRPRRSS